MVLHFNQQTNYFEPSLLHSLIPTGGATNFPDLGIAVKPKVGRALLWPSVLDSNPFDKEDRTEHEAQDVIKGLKYGAK